MKVSVLLLGIVALVGCEATLDVSRPIELIVGSGWSQTQRQVLEDAAECWNLEHGTELRLVDRDSASAEQQVPLSISDFICGYANGLTSYAGRLEVQICSLDASSPERLLTVARHELGHVLNIRDHADDPLAVMNELGTDKREKRFRPEDRHLFHGANPEFEAGDQCQVARMIGESPSRPVMVTHPTHGTVMLWSAYNGLEIRRPGQETWPLLATVPTKGIAGWLRTVPTPEGLAVIWAVGTSLYFAEVDLASQELRTIDEIDVKAHDFDREVEDLSLAVLGSDIYIAVTEDDVSAQTWIYNLSRSTGLRRHLLHMKNTWGNVHTVGSSLLFAARHPLGVGVSRMNADLTAAEYLGLEPHEQPKQLDSFNSQVVGGSLLVAHRRHKHPFGLHRVAVGDRLTLERTADVALPGKLGYTIASLAQGSAGLALAVNRVDRGSFEVFVSLLDPTSLTTRKGWKRLSAPDLTDSVQPWLAPHGGRFVAVWRDFHDLTSIEVRGRCF